MYNLNMTNKFSFEESMKRLETIVKTLESGQVSLDDSLALYEEGIQLVKACEKKLKEVEQKAVKLIDDSGESELNEL